MCGILVVVNKTRAVDVKKIENAGKLMQHRGPDCFGLNIISNNVVMTHNRLAIIDLNNRSNQPFVKNDLCLVYNGEIYNYKELIKEHDLKTNTASDTEVLLLMYEKYKEACLDYLNGMFGFAVYDLKKKELFVARDRLGVKPLYFSKTRDGIVIASEIAPILELIDDKSVDDFGIRQYRKLRMTVKGDTVYKYQYAYRYRDKLIRDTISVSKTDSIPYPVKGDTVYINKLNWYQNLSVWGFSIILGAIIIYIILKIKKIKLPL